MRFRKLRIACSIFCGLACVLSIVFWVRSYFHSDFIETRKGLTRWVAGSGNGSFILCTAALDEPTKTREWRMSSQPPCLVVDSLETRVLGFQVMHNVGDFSFGGPYWICLLFASLLGGLSGAPWIQHGTRFSLRTLLVATTVVALVLGLTVYAATH